jgi:hypothetical protein
LVESSSGLGITLAFPLRDGESNAPAIDAELNHASSNLLLAPYRASAALRQSWPYPASGYAELARLAAQHNARAVVQLGPGADPLTWPCMLALANSVLGDGADLALARYHLNRYQGLLNSATLRPLTRALYSAEISYPLASDAAYSRSFLEHLASLVPAGDPTSGDDLILWPALEAITQSVPIAQIDVGIRQLAQPPNPDVTALLTRILTGNGAGLLIPCATRPPAQSPPPLPINPARLSPASPNPG